jgi:hypothetical protein
MEPTARCQIARHLQILSQKSEDFAREGEPGPDLNIKSKDLEPV